MIAIAGCAAVPPAAQSPPQVAVPEPEPAAEPPAPAPQPPPARPPAPQPPREAPQSFDAPAAVVLSDRSPSFERVGTELGRLLEQPLVYNLADKSQSPEEAFAAIAESGAAVVIAIGFTAAEAAMALSPVPVVYCQVFNFTAEEAGPIPVKGVAAIPPLSVQIEAWQQIDPQLRNIGAILGNGHENLVAEATKATEAAGLAFHYQVAASDRETLYLFKRMAPEIDGFWLFPDNRVLSIPVLRKMVEIAGRHGVRIAVFNDALLELGVSVSTAAVESDIAETVLAVAQQVVSGTGETVPDLTPLRYLNVTEAAPSGDSAKAVAVGGKAAAGPQKERL